MWKRVLSPSKRGVSRRTVQSQATRDRAQSHERYHQFERNVARVEADRKLERYCCTDWCDSEKLQFLPNQPYR